VKTRLVIENVDKERCKVLSRNSLFKEHVTKCTSLTGAYFYRLQGSCFQLNGKKPKKPVDIKYCDTKTSKARKF